LKKKRGKRYNPAEFNKKNNQLRKKSGENKAIEEVFWRKALSFKVRKGLMPLASSRRGISQLGKRR